MTEHTPTPWSIKRAKFPADGQYDYGISAVLMDGKPYCIAETFGRCSLNFTLEAEANAAFIVKACNAHEQMLAALKNVRKIISEAAMTGFNCHDGDWAERLFASQQVTSAAIKSAEPTPTLPATARSTPGEVS